MPIQIQNILIGIISFFVLFLTSFGTVEDGLLRAYIPKGDGELLLLRQKGGLQSIYRFIKKSISDAIAVDKALEKQSIKDQLIKEIL